MIKIKKYNYFPDSVYGFGHNLYYENILDNLINNKDAICDGKSGLSSIRIINAAYQSAKEKKFIKISEN